MDYNHIPAELRHVFLRPKMYFGAGPEASHSMAWFINGFLAATEGFGMSSRLVTAPCLPDPSKSLEENVEIFSKRLFK